MLATGDFLHCAEGGRLSKRQNMRSDHAHLMAHAWACSCVLFEGARYCTHRSTAMINCLGSGRLAQFGPRPNESRHFNAPKSL